MRIVLTANTAWNLVNFRGPLISALLEDGHEVVALAPFDSKSATLEAMGCRFMPLEMDQRGLSPVRDGALILRLRRAFRAIAPDLVLGFTIKNNVYGALAAGALGIPFVPTVTGLGTAFLSGPALRIIAETLYRTAFARAPAVVFQNADDRALFVSRGLVADRQARLVAGSGIDLVQFAPQAPSDGKAGSTFLLIGRVLRDKGVMEFAEAARQVLAARPETRFELLGALGAENRSAIDPAVIEGWTRGGLLTHHDHAQDVRAFIAAADCIVLPSYREGAPRSLLEAAAMARPVIATDVPGCRDAVDAGVSGLLCRVRDGESLAGAMLEFLDMPAARRQAMGLAGRAKMEREFDLALVVSAYRRILQEVAGPPAIAA